jgi:hypothetical protein
MEISSKELEDKLAVWKRRIFEYEAVVELVRALRSIGVVMHVRCPRCGEEGSVSTLMSNGGYYVIVRHPDKSTHTVPKSHIQNLAPELCRVKKELENILQIYKKHEESGIKYCADGKPAASNPHF